MTRFEPNLRIPGPTALSPDDVRLGIGVLALTEARTPVAVPA